MNARKRNRAKLTLGIVLSGILFGLATWASNSLAVESSKSQLNARAAEPADPNKVLTVEACVKCHPSEVAVWKATPHSLTFEQLHRMPEAKEIASKMGVRSIKYDNRCVACHYTQQNDQGNPVAVSGISCESCHGAARDWVDIHHNYGGEGVTRESETAQHRQLRVANSIKAGMRNPDNVYLMAQSCYRCHTVQDEQLVNVGGHNAGSLDFEFVSWSQGLIRHNFVRSNGQVNDPSPKTRIRVMFVAGMIADLEASLRATAKATQKAEFGINAAKRSARAAARLKSVSEKISSPYVDKVLDVYSRIKLQLNNEKQLTAAADIIAVLGFEFAKSTDGESMQALDGFVPPSDRWK